jgi:hypothetical protein
VIKRGQGGYGQSTNSKLARPNAGSAVGTRISGWEACRRLEEYIRSIAGGAADYEQGSMLRLMKLEELYPTSVTEM